MPPSHKKKKKKINKQKINKQTRENTNLNENDL